MAILILDKVNEDLLLEVKGDILVHHEDTTVKSVCVPNRVLTHMKQKLMEIKEK